MLASRNAQHILTRAHASPPSERGPIFRSRGSLRPRLRSTGSLPLPPARASRWSSGHLGAALLGRRAWPAQGNGALGETNLLDQGADRFQVGLRALSGPFARLPLLPPPLLPHAAHLGCGLCLCLRQRLDPPPQAALVPLPPLPFLPGRPAPDVVPVLGPRPRSLAARDLGRHNPQDRIRLAAKRQEPPPPAGTPPRAPAPLPTGSFATPSRPPRPSPPRRPRAPALPPRRPHAPGGLPGQAAAPSPPAAPRPTARGPRAHPPPPAPPRAPRKPPRAAPAAPPCPPPSRRARGARGCRPATAARSL